MNPIARLRALCEAATPGPWRRGNHLARTLYRDEGKGVVLGMLDRDEDTAFAVAARSALPLLLDVIEAAIAMDGASGEAFPPACDRFDAAVVALAKLEVP